MPKKVKAVIFDLDGTLVSKINSIFQIQLKIF